MSVSTNQLHEINKLFLCLPYNKHLINRAKSVCMENLDLGRVYRPNAVRSVLTTSVKILPYRPPARLIRAKYYTVKCVKNTDGKRSKKYGRNERSMHTLIFSVS